MNKREMALQLKKWAGQWATYTNFGEPVMLAEIASEAAAALEREADAEEKARPKVTLQEQEHALMGARLCAATSCMCRMSPSLRCHRLDAAADTLRRLREDGGDLLRKHLNTTFPCTCVGCVLARSLGVEPAPWPEAGARSS